MEVSNNVIEYKCPSCDAGLIFDGTSQQLNCEYCGNSFDLEAVRAYRDIMLPPETEEIQNDPEAHPCWTEEDQETIRSFVCPSCGGEIITDENTAATFCPFCTNPTIIPGRLSDSLKPDAVIPFQTSKEDAIAAFKKLCAKQPPLLPKEFRDGKMVDKITGMYVPFWLFDCSGDFHGTYKATQVRTWSDSRYRYTKTDHYVLTRGARADYAGIPMDGSKKMDDTFMESIEPFDYSQITEFDKGYLTGYFVDKYDVPSEKGEERIRQRVEAAISADVKKSLTRYATAIPVSRKLKLTHSKVKYVLLPVWVLNTKFNNKIYTFVMNGQTGKIAGSFPACPKRTAAVFFIVTAAATLGLTLFQLLSWLLSYL